MAFLIVHAVSKDVQEVLYKWYNGRRRKEVQDHFVMKLGPSCYLTEATGDVLALLWALKKRHEQKLDIYAAEPLHEWDLPDKVKEVVDTCLEEKPTSKKALEEVKGIRIDCSLSSRTV